MSWGEVQHLPEFGFLPPDRFFGVIFEEGIVESDFRVLEVLFHKGPMPVNTIGPKVYLNLWSVSVVVDRLYKKGFVSRVECSSDRPVRTVPLTEKGREVFIPIFRRHTALIKRVFRDVPQTELEQLESVLKKIGKNAESLAARRKEAMRAHIDERG
jgi:MarR family 2-MHQ and catechol resistance regulon transcriptional repressor